MKFKVALFEEPYNINIREHDVPTLGKKEILVKVAYCGICGTDLHIYEGNVPFVKYPIVPGHEFSGTIVKKGSKVENYNIGDNIAVNPNLSCKDKGFNSQQYCFYCRKNRPHFCENWEAIGVTRSGAFAEYVIVPYTSVFKIPEKVSLKEGAMMEPIACCLHGIKQMNISPEDTVLIIGAGPIGLLMTSLVKSLYQSQKIIISEPMESRRDLARKFGADILIDPSKESLNQVVLAETNGQGVDISLECVGNAVLAKEAIQLLNKGGQSLIFGVAKPQDKIDLNLFDMYSNEISLYSSFTNPYENEEALKIIENKLITILELISHELPLEKIGYGIKLLTINESLKKTKEEVNKIMIRI
ncbi:MAG: zinc-dependent alcohol dehydrogenase family protein [Candidatus Hodarchaeales archaeon]|jgi:threonine dehydrogenase-like Zn-dependent dehydrogenase